MRKRTLDELCSALIRLTADQPIEFHPNRGNAGDGMICAATWQIFDRCRLAPRTFDAADREKGVFIYGGGGNLVPAYHEAASVLQDVLKRSYRHIIVLPHTIGGHEELLAQFDERVHVFCRSQISYDHVEQHAPDASVYLADDLALSLDLEAAMNPGWSRSTLGLLSTRASLALVKRRRRRLGRWSRDIASIRPTGGSLQIMRSDSESRSAEAPARDTDLSALYQSEFDSRLEAEWITRDFLRVLAQASEIETDRLHVAVGASLLGKRVRLHDNNYGKNRPVYELSLRERFPKTRFVG